MEAKEDKEIEIEDMEIMDVKAASEYLKIKEPTLYKYLQRGIIPAFKVGSFWRLEKSLLDEWIKEEIKGNQNKKKRT